MNFKSEDEAKRFLAIWALIIMGICLVFLLTAPLAEAKPREKWAKCYRYKVKKEKKFKQYDKAYNRHLYRSN